jgi:deoxyribonuclease V
MKKTDAAAKFSISKAHKAQTCMAKKVISQDNLPNEIKLVAGVDAAYAGDLAFCAAAVLDYKSLIVLETQTAVQPTKFPYVSTLLSFRELPVAVACIRKLKLKPDVFLLDAHGKAHPFGCGFASHLGLALGKPTVGVAKNRLFGEPKKIGEDVFLVQDGEIIGAVVPTRSGAKPVYVSVGNMVSLETAIKIVKHCTRSSRIPEPILQAHRLASEKRKAQMAPPTNR